MGGGETFFLGVDAAPVETVELGEDEVDDDEDDGCREGVEPLPLR